MVALFDAYGRPIDLKAERLKRQYAAAKTNRLTGGWNPVNVNVNTVIGASNTAIKGRVRQLVRDFPYFARAVNVLTNFTVGPAITFQSRVRDASGKINKRVCQQIEDGLSFWMDEADVAGKLHYYDIMRLAKRQDVESGEFVIVKTEPRDRNRFCPFALQVYESDWLTSQNDTYFGSGRFMAAAKNETEIWQGVEYYKNTGEVTAYHFTDPDSWGKTVRVPAENVIHGFDTLRPGQLRGVSPFAPAILVAHDLSDYMDAEIDAAKMAAKWLGFVETPDPGSFQALRAMQNPDNTSQMLENLENAIIEYLRPGEKVTLASNNRPGDSFSPFSSLILRMVAVTVGISYELLTGDYQGLNYTVLRGIRNDLIQEFKPVQQRHIRQFCWPTIKPALDAMVLNGRVNLPGYFINPYPYFNGQFVAPGMPPVDPLKEGKANTEQIDSLNKSPQEVAAERGRDYEEILDEIQTAREMQKERGLEPLSISKASQTNPASL